MAPRDLTAVLLACLGVYLMGNAITLAGAAAFFLTMDAADDFIHQTHIYQGLLSIGVFGLQLGLGFAVLVFGKRIAARLFAEPSRTLPQVALPDLQAAAFAVLGAYFVIDSVAALAQATVHLAPHDSILDLWPSYAAPVTQGLLGLALVLGSRVAARAWVAARQAGRVR